MARKPARVHSTMQDTQLSLASLLRHGEGQHGDAEVVDCGAGPGSRRSFADTAGRARRLAGALADLGVGVGDRVGTFMWNTPAHVETYLAVPAMGAVLHTINVRLTPEEIAYIVNHAGDTVVIVDLDLWEVFERARPLLESVRHVIVADGGRHADVDALRYEELVASAAVAEFPVVEERAAAAMCYTSGTTGRPKGIVYSHRSMYLHSMANCMASGFALSDADGLLQVVPMFHANGWGFPHAAWMAGATLLLPGRFLQAANLVNIIERERPTVSGGVPTVWRDVVEYADAHASDLSSIRVISCAGSSVPVSLMRAYDRHGVQLLQAWGMTETSPLAAIARPPGKRASEDDAWRWRAKTGRILPGLEARIVDADGRVLEPDGVAVGEFEVRGLWVTGSYYRQGDDSRFRNGWLRTGDVGTLDGAGYMEIRDRSKDLIKSGGEWISSLQIEHALADHPDVVDVAVIGVPDPRWEERPLVVLARAAGSEVTPTDLRAFLQGRLASWQVPERWAFVDSVPKTSVGKHDKIALRGSHAAGELDEQHSGSAPAPGTAPPSNAGR